MFKLSLWLWLEEKQQHEQKQQKRGTQIKEKENNVIVAGIMKQRDEQTTHNT